MSEDTTKADTEAALEAWKAAQEAIKRAWQLTPQHMLRTRMVVSRKQYNQGLSYYAAGAMVEAAEDALNTIAIHRRARESGCEWAVATDTEAVAQRDPENCRASS